MTVRWLPAALDDIELAADYLEARNPEIALRFAAEIVQAGDSLALFPNRGRPGLTKGTRELTTVRPYVLVYRVEEDTDRVTILRVWHAARDR